MAFVFKRKNSKYWCAGFYDASGKRHNRSTGETSRSKAEKAADMYEEASRKKRTAKQQRKVIEDMHELVTGEALKNSSFKTFVDSWLSKKEVEVSESTMAFYRKSVSKFTTYLGDRVDEEMTEITADDITKFRNAEAKRVTATTVNHSLKFLRMLFRSAIQERIIAENPTEFVKTAKKTQSTGRRPFTIKELQRVLRVADAEWKSMILFGFYTGQRLGDIARLKWSNVDLAGGKLRLTTQKTAKTLILPIAKHLQGQLVPLSKAAKPDSPIHPKAFKVLEQNKLTASLSNQFADLLAKAGLRDKVSHKATKNGRSGTRDSSQSLSFHCLRHTAVTLLKDAGLPAASVMEFVGHDSEQMSQHYTHVGDDALKKVADAFPKLL